MSSRAMPDSEPERRAGAAAALMARHLSRSGETPARGAPLLLGENIVAPLLDIGQGVFGGHLAREDGLQVRRDHFVVDLLAAGAQLPGLGVYACLQVRLALLEVRQPLRLQRLA